MNWLKNIFGQGTNNEDKKKSEESSFNLPTNRLILDLKSPDPLTRRDAAKILGCRIDRMAINPLFEAIMNWNEEEETIKLISVAIVINVFMLIHEEYKEMLRKALEKELLEGDKSGMFYSGVRGATEGILIKLAISGNRPNPGQSERISTIVRNALTMPEFSKVKDVLFLGENGLRLHVDL